MRLIEASTAVDSVSAGVGVPEFDFFAVSEQGPCYLTSTVEADLAGEGECGRSFAVDDSELRDEFPVGGHCTDSLGLFLEDERGSLSGVVALWYEFHDTVAHEVCLGNGHLSGLRQRRGHQE